MMKKIILTFLIIMLQTHLVWADVYRINPRISEASFLLEHVVGFSSGFIRSFDGQINVDEKTNTLKSITLELDMNSVDTFNATRDSMLKNSDFFDTAKYPQIVMTSKRITHNTVDFEVLVKGVKKTISLQYKFLGFSNDVTLAKRKAMLVLTGAVKRTELGVTHNVQDALGKPLLGDDVKLVFQIIAVK